MKKVIIGIGMVFVAGIAIAFTTNGKDKVPQVVRDAFAQKFANVKKVDWEKESTTEWEAEFKINKVKYSANFLENGTWQETEHEIDEKDVPQNVIATLRSNFPGYKIEETEMAETSKGVLYEFEIEKGKSEMEVAIDTNGKVVKQQIEDEDDKTEGDN